MSQIYRMGDEAALTRSALLKTLSRMPLAPKDITVAAPIAGTSAYTPVPRTLSFIYPLQIKKLTKAGMKSILDMRDQLNG